MSGRRDTRSSKLRAPIALFFCLATLGCVATPANFPENIDLETIRIELKRTVCEGRCPAYAVEIAGDGRVSYRGAVGVAVTGAHSDRVPVDAVLQLIEMFRRADFLSLRDKYAASWTDDPTYEVSLTASGRTKRVIDYVGKEVGMPRSVSDLEEAIDRIAETEKWVRGTAELIPSLRREGIDLESSEGSEILADAAGHGSTEAVKALTAAGARFSDTPHARQALWQAAGLKDSAEIVERLLDGGVARQDRAALTDALSAAARRGDPSMAETLIARGADPKSRSTVFWNEPILMTAVQSGNPDLVALILRHGPNVNATDDQDRTAIFKSSWQARSDRARIIQMLIDAGADLRQRTRLGSTVLHENSSAELVPLLVAHGADPNVRDGLGQTPLLRASSEELALALLAAGADPRITDDRGRSAFDVARRNNWTKVLNAIETR